MTGLPPPSAVGETNARADTWSMRLVAMMLLFAIGPFVQYIKMLSTIITIWFDQLKRVAIRIAFVIVLDAMVTGYSSFRGDEYFVMMDPAKLVTNSYVDSQLRH